jgi:energy-converting hydrogenase B subunit D
VTTLQVVALLLVAVGATGTVLTRDPTRQAIVLGAYGLTLTLLFVAFHAPGVAMAEAAVSGVLLPILVLLCLAATRADRT